MKRTPKLLYLILSLICFLNSTSLQAIRLSSGDSITESLRKIYTKREVMIKMRDGKKLYTAIYEPKDN
jgi:predicted acyl esterase